MKIKNILYYDAFKVQNDIMQELFNGGGRITAGSVKIENGEYFAVSLDGCVVYIMPSMFCYLDPECIYKNRFRSDKALQTIIDSAPRRNDVARNTGMTIENGKRTLNVFALASGEKIYFDSKLLKPFDKSATICATHPKRPASIYCGDILIGIICPVNYTEDET